MYCACVISRSSNDGLRFKKDLIRPIELNMDAKFVENFISLLSVGERNDVQNLKLSLNILKHHIYCVYNTLGLKVHQAIRSSRDFLCCLATPDDKNITISAWFAKAYLTQIKW